MNKSERNKLYKVLKETGLKGGTVDGIPTIGIGSTESEIQDMVQQYKTQHEIPLSDEELEKGLQLYVKALEEGMVTGRQLPGVSFFQYAVIRKLVDDTERYKNKTPATSEDIEEYCFGLGKNGNRMNYGTMSLIGIQSDEKSMKDVADVIIIDGANKAPLPVTEFAEKAITLWLTAYQKGLKEGGHQLNDKIWERLGGYLRLSDYIEAKQEGPENSIKTNR